MRGREEGGAPWDGRKEREEKESVRGRVGRQRDGLRGTDCRGELGQGAMERGGRQRWVHGASEQARGWAEEEQGKGRTEGLSDGFKEARGKRVGAKGEERKRRDRVWKGRGGRRVSTVSCNIWSEERMGRRKRAWGRT